MFTKKTHVVEQWTWAMNIKTFCYSSSLVPTAAITFVASGNEIWSSQIHHPKSPEHSHQLPTFSAKLIAFYKKGFYHV